MKQGPPSDTTNKKIIYGVVAAVLVAASLAAGYSWGDAPMQDSGKSGCREDLIDPASCSGEASNQLSFLAFRTDLEEHLARAQKSGQITNAGIYFRDLRNGPIVTLNSNDAFMPMSLMKMPLMIAVLRYAQDNPGVLEEKVRTPESFGVNIQLMNESETLMPDKEYTINEMLEYLISYSDNRALGMLGMWLDERAGRNAVIDTLVNLGLMRPQDTVPNTTVSPRTYGAILRILYGAAYLNPEYSQNALDILTKTKFKEGIANGLPESVKVAHKFGVNDEGSGDVQLHDCGIVYHPVGPYTLCVMTNGTDFNQQARYIQEVASRVYDHVATESQREQQ